MGKTPEPFPFNSNGFNTLPPPSLAFAFRAFLRRVPEREGGIPFFGMQGKGGFRNQHCGLDRRM
ncbi:hypothetical protein Syun_020813 [Stephania yunnanensis]|uniref:Uncharacterized protein n=1 Tax=Stephania yunnanensis TaxID=152371 RepID=A0AAP0IFT6_9MAGN